MTDEQTTATQRHKYGCCVDKACTEATCMALPQGKTCGDCMHERRDAARQAARRQQAGLLDKAQSSKQVTAQGAECAAKGSGPGFIGKHGPRGALQRVWCGEPPNVGVEPHSAAERT